MHTTKYISIDKDIIKENAIFDFTLFIPSSEEKKMDRFIPSKVPVTQEDIDKLNDIASVYINKKERAYYLNYYNHFIKHTQNKYISFEDKASQVYQKALEILTMLFANPEAVETYKASKGVVNELVDTVLAKDFNIDSIIDISEQSYSSVTHSINVTIYAINLGAYLNLNKENLENLGEAALLHDIGKSKIAQEIVNKEGKLTDAEFAEMKKYPRLGYMIALKLGIKNKDILMGIKLHQERMDGSGYPLGFKEKSIPFIARVIGICDVFDALTSKKTYREPMGAFEALLLMKTKMSKQLDIKILNKMIEMFR